MLTAENMRYVNEMLSELGDLLDPAGRREVLHAYTTAQNSMCSLSGSEDAFFALAEKLRRAAVLADALAEEVH